MPILLLSYSENISQLHQVFILWVLGFGYTKTLNFFFFKFHLLQANALAFKTILQGEAKDLGFVFSALWPFSAAVGVSILTDQTHIK